MEFGSSQDYLVYPIVFLYRHNLELRLKDTIRKLRYVLGEPFDFPRDHKIEKSWSEVDNLMSRIIAEIDDKVGEFILNSDRELLRSTIKEFSDVDPGSFAFRYPEDRQGSKNLPGLMHINIRMFAEQMESMSQSLSKYEVVAGFLFDHTLEMNAIAGENGE